MKSLKRFFGHNKHSKEDKENQNQSHHVQFDDDQQDNIQPQPQRKALKRRTSMDDFPNLNPYSSSTAKPRVHRPAQSCAGKVTGNEYASSSDDDQSTLVSQRTSYQKPSRKRTGQFQLQQQKRIQINYCGTQTSSEYGSGDPSPVNKHVAFESHFENDYYTSSRETEYWKKKYRHYKDFCKQLNVENLKLHQRNKFYEGQIEFYKEQENEINNLRKQNLELQSQLHSLNMKLHSYGKNYFLPQQLPSAYPMILPPLSNQFNQIGGAGEQLASKSQMPGFRSSLISSIHGNSNFEEDELKNFRNNGSSSDDPYANVTNTSMISNSTEEARGDVIFSSPLRQTSSLTILQDDGYSSHGMESNHSNQTLTTLPNAELKVLTENTEEIMKTPIKQIRRRVRFLSN